MEKFMKRWLLILILIGTFFLFSSCSLFKVEDTNLTAAQDTLESFFELLSHRVYAEAAGLYGGDYNTLRSMNPTVPIEDVAMLWQNACEKNGFQCLEIRDVIRVNLDNQGIYTFLVEFSQKDGNLLKVSTGLDEPQQKSQFEFSVRRNRGSFTVLNPPVLLP
jgi:hypothetical protein